MATKAINPILPQNTDLLSNDQAATYIGVTPRTLEVWRCTKRYPIPFIKVGRLVKYRRSSLNESSYPLSNSDFKK